MKDNNSNLEWCIQKLEESTQKGVINPGIEIYAVNNLKNKKDILKFRSEYIEFMKNFISQEIDTKKKTHATNLIDKGYSLQKVAAFFVHDGLMFTLGHIFNQDILDSWYSSLPYMKSEFPKEMYQK